MKRYINSLILLLAVLYLLIGIIKDPEMALSSASKGLSTCFNIVFPSLFPFFIISELLIEIGFVNFIGSSLQAIMKPVFNVPGEGVFPFTMSIISGYPMGARITSRLREKKMLSKIEAERTVCFSSTSGPLFMLGAVSVGMLNAPTAAPLILYPHYLGAMTVGLLLRFYGKNTTTSSNKSKYVIRNPLNYINKNHTIGEILGNCIGNSINTILTVGGFIVFYSVAIDILINSKIFSRLLFLIDYIIPVEINIDLLQGLIAGILEITTGCSKISSLNINFIQKVLVINFLIGWGGLSIHSQAISFISKTDINTKLYLFSKLLHGIFSSLYTLLIYSLIFKNHAEFSFVPEPNMPQYIYASNWTQIFMKSTKLALLIMFYMLVCSMLLIIVKRIFARE